MRRRHFIISLPCVTSAWPFVARAQHRVLPVIGILSTRSRPPAPWEPDHGRVAGGLRKVGYVAGQNVTLEFRFADGHYDRLPALAADLVSRKVDLIMTFGGSPPALAAKNATSTIPIVFADAGDPVEFGLVASLPRPGGNLTGFSNLALALTPKRVALLCELVPQAMVIALLVNPDNQRTGQHIRAAQDATRAKGIELRVLKAGTEGAVDTAFASLGQLQVGGLVVEADGFLDSRRAQLVGLASRYAVPTVYFGRSFTTAGGLISYGIDSGAVLRQVAIYAARILKGAKPDDLPVQQPTAFELVVNLKTAKMLGLTIPRSILARANEVIE